MEWIPSYIFNKAGLQILNSMWQNYHPDKTASPNPSLLSSPKVQLTSRWKVIWIRLISWSGWHDYSPGMGTEKDLKKNLKQRY